MDDGFDLIIRLRGEDDKEIVRLLGGPADGTIRVLRDLVDSGRDLNLPHPRESGIFPSSVWGDTISPGEFVRYRLDPSLLWLDGGIPRRVMTWIP